MELLKFSAFQLIIGEQKPEMSVFKNLSKQLYHKDKETIYKVLCEKIEDRFLWIYINYGKSLPYSNEIVNTNQPSKSIKNPRTKEQAELNHQVFSLYDSLNENFYISNSHKKAVLENFLKKQLSKDVVIKRYYISPPDFIQKIKSINKIKLTSKRNLFSQKSGLFEDVRDVFGLGEPESFTIDINYTGQSRKENFIQFLEKFIRNKVNKEIDSLVCIGKNDNDMELVFNIESYTQTVFVDVIQNNLGLYDVEEVKNNIIQKIKKSDR